MPRLRTLLLLAGDAIVLIASFLFAAWCITALGGIWNVDFYFFLLEENGITSILAVTLSILLGLYFLDLYNNIRIASVRRFVEDFLLVLGMTFLLQAFLSYIRVPFVVPRYLMLFGSMFATVVLTSWRYVFNALLLTTIGLQRVVFVGDSPITRSVAAFIVEHPERGYRPVAVLDSHSDPLFPGCPLRSPEPSLLAEIESLQPDLIVIARHIEAQPEFVADLLQCSMRGMAIQNVSDLYESLFERVALDLLTYGQIIFSSGFHPKPLVVAAQRIYGRLFALIGLVIAWPIMILTAIAVRLDSPGPAILRQTRLGQGGVPFTFLKFRSMFVNADAISGPVRAQENDPRITRVGRWIRLTRIDELPQLINILRGDINVVGPRPEMPALEAALLKDLPLYPQRHRIKPGLTGWAQIHHTPEDSINSTARKLEYDLYYIKHMTPALDLLIIFHTFKAVLFRIGAR